eukprot:Clim_evm2s139 gene=Clim_evmTU2s139
MAGPAGWKVVSELTGRHPAPSDRRRLTWRQLRDDYEEHAGFRLPSATAASVNLPCSLNYEPFTVGQPISGTWSARVGRGVSSSDSLLYMGTLKGRVMTYAPGSGKIVACWGTGNDLAVERVVAHPTRPEVLATCHDEQVKLWVLHSSHNAGYSRGSSMIGVGSQRRGSNASEASSVSAGDYGRRGYHASEHITATAMSFEISGTGHHEVSGGGQAAPDLQPYRRAAFSQNDDSLMAVTRPSGAKLLDIVSRKTLMSFGSSTVTTAAATTDTQQQFMQQTQPSLLVADRHSWTAATPPTLMHARIHNRSSAGTQVRSSSRDRAMRRRRSRDDGVGSVTPLTVRRREHRRLRLSRTFSASGAMEVDDHNHDHGTRGSNASILTATSSVDSTLTDGGDYDDDALDDLVSDLNRDISLTRTQSDVSEPYFALVEPLPPRSRPAHNHRHRSRQRRYRPHQQQPVVDIDCLIAPVFHPKSTVLLYGSSMWDWRAPHGMLHDFAPTAQGLDGPPAFHPNGYHLFLGRHVYDLRYLHSSGGNMSRMSITGNDVYMDLPALSSCTVHFTANGRTLVAYRRNPSVTYFTEQLGGGNVQIREASLDYGLLRSYFTHDILDLSVARHADSVAIFEHLDPSREVYGASLLNVRRSTEAADSLENSPHTATALRRHRAATTGSHSMLGPGDSTTGVIRKPHEEPETNSTVYAQCMTRRPPPEVQGPVLINGGTALHWHQFMHHLDVLARVGDYRVAGKVAGPGALPWHQEQTVKAMSSTDVVSPRRTTDEEDDFTFFASQRWLRSVLAPSNVASLALMAACHVAEVLECLEVDMHNASPHRNSRRQQLASLSGDDREQRLAATEARIQALLSDAAIRTLALLVSQEHMDEPFLVAKGLEAFERIHRLGTMIADRHDTQNRLLRRMGKLVDHNSFLILADTGNFPAAVQIRDVLELTWKIDICLSYMKVGGLESKRDAAQHLVDITANPTFLHDNPMLLKTTGHGQPTSGSGGPLKSHVVVKQWKYIAGMTYALAVAPVLPLIHRLRADGLDDEVQVAAHRALSNVASYSSECRRYLMRQGFADEIVMYGA